MQRSRVLLPEPERPMIATTSPRSTSTDTPFRTSVGPKLFRTSTMSTSGMELPFQTMGIPGEREAEREIDRGHQRVDQEGPEGRVVEHGAGLGQVDEADDRGERGTLDHLHREAHRRR